MAADRIEDRVEWRDRLENSEVKVLSERVDTFLLGGRKRSGDDPYAELGRLIKTFLFLVGGRSEFRSGVTEREPGLRGLMKP